MTSTEPSTGRMAAVARVARRPAAQGRSPLGRLPATVTFEADESCPLPPSLKVLTYDVLLEPSPYHYLGVRVPSKPFVGDLWPFAAEQLGLRWNVDCESPEAVGSISFYL